MTVRGTELRRVGKQPYVVVRGLTEVWELKGEGPCWKGLGLWPSGVAGEVLGRTRPTGWMAPGRVCRGNERYFTKMMRSRYSKLKIIGVNGGNTAEHELISMYLHNQSI